MASDVKVEMLLDGEWEEFSPRASQPVVISRGRADWASTVDSSRATMLLDNRDGALSPDYAGGAHYGNLQRNIPVRISKAGGVKGLYSTGFGTDLVSTPDIAGAGGGAPSAPAFAAVVESEETSYTTSHTFDLPATLAEADRLLLLVNFGHQDWAPTDQGEGVTDLDDWTLVDSGNIYTPWNGYAIYERGPLTSAQATALEGGTVEFTTSVAVRSSAQVIRTTGARSGGEGSAWNYLSTTSKAFGDEADPPFLLNSYGADEHRWYAITFFASNAETVDSYPTNYTSIAEGNTTSLVQIATAHRTTSAAGEDPGVFTFTGDENSFAMTFVYRALEDKSADGALDISSDIELRAMGFMLEDVPDSVEDGTMVELASKRSGLTGWQWGLYQFEGDLVSRWRWDSSTGTNNEYTYLPLWVQNQEFALWLTMDVDNGASGYEYNLYIAEDIDGPWTLLHNHVGDATTDILTNDAPILLGGDPNNSFVEAFPGALLAFRMTDGLGGTDVCDVDFRDATLGVSSVVGDDGLTWTLGEDAEISDRQYRFHGELASLPLRENQSGQDLVVPIEANGLFRRLRQGNRRLNSAVYRSIVNDSTGLIQYWPMNETGDTVDSFGAAVGNSSMDVIGGNYPKAASYSNFLSAGKIPVIDDCTFLVYPDTYPASSGWQVRWFQGVPADFTGEDLQYIHVSANDLVWIVLYDDGFGGQQKVLAYRDGTEVYDSGYFAFDATGTDRRYSLSVTQNGSNVNVTLVSQTTTESVAGGFTDVAAVAAQAGQVSQIRINRNRDINDWAFGHVTLQDRQTSSTELTAALNANQGELAGRRIQRLCREEGIDTRIIGDVDDTEPMGPQLEGTLMDLLQECADTDLGILFESRDSVAVGYRTRTDMTNQVVDVRLDASAGNLAAPLRPVRDDQHFANDVEIENWNGTKARAVLNDDSAISVSNPPVGMGVYDSAFKVNALNTRLNALADTRLALSAVDEPRVPSLKVNYMSPSISGDADLPDLLRGLDLGDRLQVINNRTVTVGTKVIDVLMQGYTETLGPVIEEAEMFATPALPWSGEDVVAPPEQQFVRFRTQQELAVPGSPDHVLTALGYTSDEKITRADLDGILDDWVTSTGGTTHEVTSSAEWNTALGNAQPGDLVRVTSGFTGSELAARGERFGITSGATLGEDGLPGLPIVLTCADGEYVEPDDTANNDGALDVQNCKHIWVVGFNVRDSQFGIRAMNWGGEAGFPAYMAYNDSRELGHNGIQIQGWFQALTSSGGTAPVGEIASPGQDWGYCEYFVCESNTVVNPGRTADEFGEAYYFGTGTGGGGWHSFARDGWIRGNYAEGYTSDAYDIKPGCYRIKGHDNVGYNGYSVSGAPFMLCLVVTSNSSRPSWFDFDPEIYWEGNRIYDSNVTTTDGSSDNIMGLIGLSGIRVANNMSWSHPQTGSYAAWRIRNQKGSNDSEAIDEFRTDPTWIVNQTERGAEGVDIAGYGASVTAFPTAITDIIDVRNVLVRNGSPGTGEVDSDDADFIATVPALGAAGDAEWQDFGPGSAFDLDEDSSLIGAGESISDLALFINADICNRAIPESNPNPGAFQPFVPSSDTSDASYTLVYSRGSHSTWDDGDPWSDGLDTDDDWTLYGSSGESGTFDGNNGWGGRRHEAVSTTTFMGTDVLQIEADQGSGLDSGLVVSGGLKLRGNFNRSITYGRVRIRARVDDDVDEVTSGIALLWAQANPNTRTYELDIFENFAHRDDRTPIQTFYHWIEGDDNSPVTQEEWDGLATSDWHDYEVIWTPSLITVQVDDETPRVLSSDPDEIMQEPMEIAFQLDAWPNPSTPSTQPSMASGPVQMHVSYFSIEQLN